MRKLFIKFTDTRALILAHDNRYYILRDDLVGYYVNDLLGRLASRQDQQKWQVSHTTPTIPRKLRLIVSQGSRSNSALCYGHPGGRSHRRQPTPGQTIWTRGIWSPSSYWE